jgi:hypothetical protein
MKKLLGIVLALALAIAISVPVLATSDGGVGTGATIVEGGGAAPIIKCKWEQDQSVYPAGHPQAGQPGLEAGDFAHTKYVGDGTGTPCNAQFLPSLTFNVSTMVEYWAIITDPDDNAQHNAIISVDVYHPMGPPEDGSFKYQLILTEVEKGLLYDGSGNVIGYEPGKGKDKFLKAWDAHLVTVGNNPGTGYPYTKDEIIYEIDKCTAKIYMVVGELEYHQPCGNYRVVIKAQDQHGNHANPLENCMTYVCMQAMRIDFTSVSYGNVALCKETMITGDLVFETPGPTPPVKPTVHNIGNMPLKVKIKQNDMGFGFSGTSPTTYQGSAAPNATQSNWNVVFDARVGSNPADARYFDPCCLKSGNLTACTAVEVILPTVLMPCTPQEIDLSIHVKKADVASYTGKMILECVEQPWPS